MFVAQLHGRISLTNQQDQTLTHFLDLARLKQSIITQRISRVRLVTMIYLNRA